MQRLGVDPINVVTRLCDKLRGDCPPSVRMQETGISLSLEQKIFHHVRT